MIPLKQSKKLNNDVKIIKLQIIKYKITQKEWNENEIENPYKNYKKSRNFFRPYQMWDEDLI